MARPLSTRVFALGDHSVSCSERLGRCPVSREEGAGWPFVSHVAETAGDVRVVVAGSARL
jgi:hypothetical protein